MENKPAYTTDVGTGGFCAESMRVLQPGTTVQGTITFGGRDFDYVGLVRWTRPGNARVRLAGHMGIRFLHVSTELGALLARHLARH